MGVRPPYKILKVVERSTLGMSPVTLDTFGVTKSFGLFCSSAF